MSKIISFSIKKSELWISRKINELHTKTGLNKSFLICRCLMRVLDKALEDPGILLQEKPKDSKK